MNDLLNEIKNYFKIQEFVDKQTYEKWGENAWMFFDENLLKVILVLRKHILKVPLVCNDWSFGGKNQQRGLRTNLSPLVKEKTDKGQLYLSAHLRGHAVDLVSSKMTAANMRKLILANQNELPCKIRCEDGVSWLHIDTMPMINQKEKVYLFKG